jgi:hypothetical protein
MGAMTSRMRQARSLSTMGKSKLDDAGLDAVEGVGEATRRCRDDEASGGRAADYFFGRAMGWRLT